MTAHTEVRQHQYVEFRMSDVKLVVVDGEEHFVPDPMHEPEVTYGCKVCNMGLAEAREVSCPGQDLFEEGQGEPIPD